MFHKVASSSDFRSEHNRPKVTILLGPRIKFKRTTRCEKRIVPETIHRENGIDRLVLALQISGPLSPNSTKLRNKQTNFILRTQALFANYSCNLIFKFLIRCCSIFRKAPKQIVACTKKGFSGYCYTSTTNHESLKAQIANLAIFDVTMTSC